MKPIKIILTQAGSEDEKLIFTDIAVSVGGDAVKNSLEEIIQKAIELPKDITVQFPLPDIDTPGIKQFSIAVYYKNRLAKTFETNLIFTAFKREERRYKINPKASEEQIRDGMKKLKAFIVEIENWAKKQAQSEKRYVIEI